jgi:outer membrane murein-binding lipoprotein Lpp
MSTPPLPPDRPTEPLVPRAPVAPAVPVAAERMVEPVVDPQWVARLEDQIRSLRTFMALLTLLSLAALGVGVYALIKAQDNQDQSASQSRVARLDNRVDQVESDLKRKSEETDVSRLEGRLSSKADDSKVSQLQQSVTQLRTQLKSAGENKTDATKAVTDLGSRVDTLSRQVQELRDSAP